MQDGRSRRCIVHVPPARQGGHARSLSFSTEEAAPRRDGQADKNRFNELADAYGFFVAYPGGLGRSWNDFRDDAKGYSHGEKIDDVGSYRP